MATKGFIKELTRIVGSENILFSRRDLLAYSYDATQHQEMPEFIVFPNSTAQISKVMKLAHSAKMPVIPRGAGTGISGGTVPIKGGIILEISRMNRIMAIDTANRRAIVEPGVINLDLQEVLAPLGFMYPPDPASQKSCTIGGNVGENAGGPLCFRYGVTTKYICGMEVVLAAGEVVEFGGDVEDTSGYDFRGLLVGSEGTLGIATRLTLNILPMSEASKTMLAIFDTLEDAGQAVSDIISAGIVPGALELMDKKMCWAIEQSLHAGYPVDAEGVLLIEVAGLAIGLESQARDISEICQRNKVRELRFAKTGTERDALWKGRKGAFGSIARICPQYLVNDGTVPRNKLVPALRRTQELAEKYHVQIANVAHAGDGNLHPLILFDRDNPAESAAAKKASEEILDACLAFGGTISGEHGIGLEKLAAMTRMFSPADLAFMRRVKQVFDPDGILNPGKLLPPEADQRPQAEATSPVANTAIQTPHQRLGGIVGAENIKTSNDAISSYQVDGFKPDAVIFASSTEQVSEIIKAGNQYQMAIVPLGSRSKQQVGPCVSAADTILCLRNMKQILDLDIGNSTVRVEAGIANNELQKELAKYKLFFPLDPLFRETSTIGGELAANDSGPARFMYGTARDLVLGLTVVTPTGEIIHPGGKTMKNVAGLDLCKMFIGSWGTLGVITEAILRLFPSPEVNRSLCLIFPTIDDAFRLVNQLLNSKLLPGAIELVEWIASPRLELNYGTPLKEGEILIKVDVEGSNEVVEKHLKDISAMAVANGIRHQVIIENGMATGAWNTYHQVHQSVLSEARLNLKGKVSVPISKSVDMFKAIKKVGSKHNVDIGITAHCGNGILYPYVLDGKDSDILNIVDDLKQEAVRLGGFFVVEAAPLRVRKNAGVWPEFKL